MPAPPTHFALVGLLWTDFEQALRNAGASGASAKQQIDSLRHRLPRHDLAQMHYVRLQRNSVMHAPSRPLANPVLWERLCREGVQTLRALPARGTAPWPPVRSGSSAPRVRSYAPAPVRGGAARAGRAAGPLRPAPRRRGGGDDGFPLWAKVLAWGGGAYVVLNNETLTSLAGLGGICWLLWSIFGKR